MTRRRPGRPRLGRRPILRGSRVTLRPGTQADHPAILAWQNQPEVWWLMDYEHPFTLEDIAASEARARSEGWPFIIEAEGRPIGRIGLDRFHERDRRCALYIFIGVPEAWGRGYGRDAITTLLADAFARFELDLIELWSLADNERAIRAYRACGFCEDGRLRGRSLKDGRRHDHLIMSITREEFAATSSRVPDDAAMPAVRGAPQLDATFGRR